MKIIQGISRQQMQFSSFDDQITADNPVRILDVFVEKLDLNKLGMKQRPALKDQSSKINPGGAPRFDDRLLLKLYIVEVMN